MNLQPLPLSVWLDAYRTDMRSAIHQAARDDFRLLTANTAGREWNPASLADSARRHLRNHLADLGVRLDALHVHYPGAGMADSSAADERFDRFVKSLELCRSLGVSNAAVTISGFDDPNRGDLAQQLLHESVAQADRFGIRLTLVDPAALIARTRELLRAVNYPGLRANVDAAGNWTPQELSDIARDAGAAQLRDVSAVGDSVVETPLGGGRVDFAAFLWGLRLGDFSGSYLIRPLTDSLGVDELGRGREYIASLAGRPPEYPGAVLLRSPGS
jgi:sugar phosphate isomerase/epimerase